MMSNLAESWSRLWPRSAFTFDEMDAMVGCISESNDVRKQVVFRREYYGHTVTWQGKVDAASAIDVFVKFKQGKNNTNDFDVDLAAGQSGVNLENGDLVTLKFTIASLGGCSTLYHGEGGVILASQQ